MTFAAAGRRRGQHDGQADAPEKTYGPPGRMTGRPVISSCSLAKVIIEPAKETEPTSTVNAVRRLVDRRR